MRGCCARSGAASANGSMRSATLMVYLLLGQNLHQVIGTFLAVAHHRHLPDDLLLYGGVRLLPGERDHRRTVALNKERVDHGLADRGVLVALVDRDETLTR